MANTAATEQRGAPRVRTPLCIWVSFGGDAAAYATMAMNISPDGAACRVPRQVKKGQEVRLALDIPPEPVESRGEVRWSATTPDGYSRFGVQFFSFPTEMRVRLEEYLGLKAVH